MAVLVLTFTMLRVINNVISNGIMAAWEFKVRPMKKFVSKKVKKCSEQMNELDAAVSKSIAIFKKNTCLKALSLKQ